MNSELRNKLMLCQARVKGLHALTGAFGGDTAREMDAFFDAVLNPKHEDGKALTGEDIARMEREQCAAVLEAHGNPEKMKELCALRVDVENNYIRATSNYAETMFEVVTLKDDERPALQNETQQEIDVGYISQDGKPRLTKALAQQAEFMLPLRVLSTDRFGYFTRDLYNGNITNCALRTVDIAFDAKNKYDQNAFNLLTASRANGGTYGTFDLTNTTRVSRDFVTNSRMVTANLPTTNDIVLAGNTAAGGLFRVLDVISAIIAYCSAWGDSFADGPLKPTGVIMVPSSEIVNITATIKPTGSTNNPVANELMQRFTGFTYLNVDWVLIPDVTLPPGKCYPILNKPVGRIYLKPSQDREVVKLDEENDFESRMMKKVVSYSIPSNRRLRALRIDYKTGS